VSGRWVDIGEAARELGISTEAIRKRIQRGKLLAERDQDKLQVWLDEIHTKSGPQAQGEASALVEELRAHNATLREQLEVEREANRENRRIIAALTQRIPELEPPRERPHAEASSAAPGGFYGPTEEQGPPQEPPGASQRPQEPPLEEEESEPPPVSAEAPQGPLGRPSWFFWLSLALVVVGFVVGAALVFSGP
jgi:hypothetical protein